MEAIRDKTSLSKATMDDVGALTVLFDEYRTFYKMEHDIPGIRVFLSERVLRGDSVIFVTKSGDVMMGFMQLYPLLSSTRMKRLWLLNDLYINPQYRGLGISVLLIDQAKQFAKDTDSAGLILETAKSNTIGNNLYLKTGFALDNDHNYYSWNEA
jgi:GNAT superfamily N-acetyltransferase